MADDQTKQRVEDALKKAYFGDPSDLVDVSNGLDDNIHVVVVSRKFDGKRLREKNDLIWSILTEQLDPEVWGKVTLSIGVSPEEIKATSI
jgi:stress-induced morphogen